MSFHDQDQDCHAERSEASLRPARIPDLESEKPIINHHLRGLFHQKH